MCSKCANLENRLSAKQIERIRATDRFRGSKEHQDLMKRIRAMFSLLLLVSVNANADLTLRRWDRDRIIYATDLPADPEDHEEPANRTKEAEETEAEVLE